MSWTSSQHPRDLTGRFADVAANGTVATSRHPGNRHATNHTLPDVHVMPYSASDHADPEPWQRSADRHERAGAIWSDTFHGLHAVRETMRNLWAGRAHDDGIDPVRGWLSKYTDAGARYEPIPGMSNTVAAVKGTGTYTREHMAADIHSAALTLQQRLAAAPVITKRLYRGMRLDPADIPTEGSTFDQDVASWTDQKDWAQVYAHAREDQFTRGSHHVIMRMVGPKRASDMYGILAPGMNGSGEHIASGRYRVRKVSKRGRQVTVEVEQVDPKAKPAADGRAASML